MLKFPSWSAHRAGRYMTASAMVLAAGAMLASTVPASAEPSAQIKDMSFTTQSVYNQVIRVVSSDNKKWDSIKPGSVSFGAHVMIDTRHYVLPLNPRGWTKHVGIVLGHCYGAPCDGRPLLWERSPFTKDYENQMAVTFPTSKIPLSGIAAGHVPIGKQIIAQCNEKVTMGGGKAHSFNKLIPLTFVADTVLSVFGPANHGGTGADNGTPPVWTRDTDHFRNSNVVMKVECEPFEREKAEDVEDVNMVTKNIELKVVAPASPTTKPNPSTSCRKGKLTVRMEANRVGPVKYRLWSKAGDAPMTSKVIDMWASEVAPGNVFIAEHSEWVTVTKTSTVQAMAEDMVNPIGQTTGWKEALVRCEPTQGGFADAPKPGVDDPVVKPLELSGELTLADQAGAPKDKPRTAQAVFKIWASRPGSTSYRLTCSGGRQWEGTLPTYKVADKKYQAVGAHNIQINKTEQIGCSLRSLEKPSNPLLALATKLFTLIKVNPSTAGDDTIADKPRPTHDKPSTNRPNARPNVIVTPKPPKRPAKPAIKVAPKPRLVCLNGKVSRNKCFCPSRTKKKKIGANAYRCDRAVVKPQRVVPKAPPKRKVTSAPPKRVAPKKIAPKRVPPKTAAPKRVAPKKKAPGRRKVKLNRR